MLAPFGFPLGEREVGHEVVGRGAVPVPLAWWGDDDVAGSDADERSATGLDEAFVIAAGGSGVVIAADSGVGWRGDRDPQPCDREGGSPTGMELRGRVTVTVILADSPRVQILSSSWPMAS